MPQAQKENELLGIQGGSGSFSLILCSREGEKSRLARINAWGGVLQRGMNFTIQRTSDQNRERISKEWRMVSAKSKRRFRCSTLRRGKEKTQAWDVAQGQRDLLALQDQFPVAGGERRKKKVW